MEWNGTEQRGVEYIIERSGTNEIKIIHLHTHACGRSHLDCNPGVAETLDKGDEGETVGCLKRNNNLITLVARAQLKTVNTYV